MLGLSVRVPPLLRKDVQMSAIRVEGLSLDLVRDKQGKGNWENIGKPAQPQAPAAPSATPPAADGKGAQAQAPEQAPQNDSPRTPIKPRHRQPQCQQRPRHLHRRSQRQAVQRRGHRG